MDTSILIGIYRRRIGSVGETVARLILKKEAYICGAVWVEFLSGFRSTGKRRLHANDLSIIPWLDTTRAAFEMAAELRATHPALSAADAIIAATAFTHGATLLTADSDFSPLASRGVQIIRLT